MHVHVVQKGDTLWKISRQYGVSFDEVKRLNAHLANPDYIVPGMKIFVPEKSTKKQEIKDHPYANDRPVKNNKEEYVPKALPKSLPKSMPKAMPQPMPQPKPYPPMQPIHIHMPEPKQPQPIPQPTMQMPPQVFQQPINQHLTMTQMVPPYMGVPYGWVPVPDMDVHQPQVLPTTPPIQKPQPKPLPKHIPAPKLPQGWQLDDSSSLGDVESSLQVPQLSPQYQQPPSPCGPPPPEYYQQQLQPEYYENQQAPSPCGPPPPAYYQHQQPPCGCGQPSYAQPASGYMPQQGPSPDVMQESDEMMHHPNMMPQQMMHDPNMMPQQMMHDPNMMPQQMMPHHMMPYMRCTPCHMLPAPQGQWGYPTPVRYY
ncbi:LysM peptidoglycan-binding domain-containing protein [Paenisporosarcina antarctica]|uniref:SafA/ExsA family spore coat assembly protein n=1 Tax=Paenisporosarcina antarctica TaxID=417367 RepID=A0A4P6ZWN3_9BACL|nr:LysM domain-containing protein [Paenisporosarcina antarctica]QBP40792.1 SafA/ExsA family spore coat assembly protein [Paenisporosarcina antarctica]